MGCLNTYFSQKYFAQQLQKVPKLLWAMMMNKQKHIVIVNIAKKNVSTYIRIT